MMEEYREVGSVRQAFCYHNQPPAAGLCPAEEKTLHQLERHEDLYPTETRGGMKMADVRGYLWVNRHVRKVGGSYQHTGTVVSYFTTKACKERIVVEFDPPVAGMLHILRPDQVEVIE